MFFLMQIIYIVLPSNMCKTSINKKKCMEAEE